MSISLVCKQQHTIFCTVSVVESTAYASSSQKQCYIIFPILHFYSYHSLTWCFNLISNALSLRHHCRWLQHQLSERKISSGITLRCLFLFRSFRCIWLPSWQCGGEKCKWRVTMTYNMCSYRSTLHHTHGIKKRKKSAIPRQTLQNDNIIPQSTSIWDTYIQDTEAVYSNS